MWRNIYKASFCLAFSFLVCSIQGKSQQQSPKVEALSLETGKTGLIFSLTYDQRFKGKKTGLRVGMGTNLSHYLKLITIGGGAYYLVGKTKDFLELGTDIHFLNVNEESDDQRGFWDLVYPDETINTYYLSGNIGYRRYGKKMLLRMGFSPGVTSLGFVPGGYLSLGFILK